MICDILRRHGADVLGNPRRMRALVKDHLSEDDRVVAAFVNNCADDYLAIFAQAVDGGTSSDVELAAEKAEDYLRDHRSISARMSRVVSQAVAQGVGEYLGVSVDFDSPDEATPKVTCWNCGTQNSAADVYCIDCGVQLRKISASAEPDETTTSQHERVNGPRTKPEQTQDSGQTQRVGRDTRKTERIPPTMVTCPACGAQNRAAANFCVRCAHPLRDVEQHDSREEPKSTAPRWLVVLIAVLLCAVVALTLTLCGRMGDDGFTFPWFTGGDTGTGVDGGETDDGKAEGDGGEKAEGDGNESDDGEKSDDGKTGGNGAEGDGASQDEDDEVDLVPEFRKASASSSLEEGRPEDYDPSNVLDHDRTTSWQEGSNDYELSDWTNGRITGSAAEKLLGVGEWIELSAEGKQRVSGFDIINGYSKPKPNDWEDRSNGDTFYYDNGRVKSMEVRFSDGSEEFVYLDDPGPGVRQHIEFDKPHDTTYVRFIITGAYDTNLSGGRATYPDTTIDEIEVF
ncbi:MAG: zinc ribbon domain-containing protein [Atopobiaceae bacterium]|nr:zinc ribbon domain-containing protein [Atopobiaceae bacterium]